MTLVGRQSSDLIDIPDIDARGGSRRRDHRFLDRADRRSSRSSVDNVLAAPLQFFGHCIFPVQETPSSASFDRPFPVEQAVLVFSFLAGAAVGVEAEALEIALLDLIDRKDDQDVDGAELLIDERAIADISAGTNVTADDRRQAAEAALGIDSLVRVSGPSACNAQAMRGRANRAAPGDRGKDRSALRHAHRDRGPKSCRSRT